ncbi:MAG: ATP-binding cassette domain-containing protein, partial [Proteobacteria bacterium]|nr:ATP-binding cassette domain-containing protein [Pseudomonadota bacterium]
MNQIIEVINLSKFFGENQAVADASFSVKEGICFGLLGPNGAGKSTTMEIVEDIITASSGEILYKGQPRSASFREEIGIQFQHTSLLAGMAVQDIVNGEGVCVIDPHGDLINDIISRVPPERAEDVILF